MATITLNYNAKDALINSIINSALLAGATQVPEKDITKAQKNDIGKQYERLFGKKKTYSESEVFVFNSMRNAAKILEKYEN